MCWRDNLSRRERDEMFEQYAWRFRLQTREAWKGCSVHVDTEYTGSNKKRYFRKDYFSNLAGPSDTTEILFMPGTVVIVTDMPEDVRKKFGLRATSNPRKSKFDLRAYGPRAKIIKIKGKTGLLFGKAGTKVIFPLSSDQQICFTVHSIPRS